MRHRTRPRHLSTGSTTTASPATPAPAPPSTSATGAPDMSPPKPSPGIISRNIGKIVLLTLSSLIAYLYRSSEVRILFVLLRPFLHPLLRRCCDPKILTGSDYDDV